MSYRKSSPQSTPGTRSSVLGRPRQGGRPARNPAAHDAGQATANSSGRRVGPAGRPARAPTASARGQHRPQPAGVRRSPACTGRVGRGAPRRTTRPRGARGSRRRLDGSPAGRSTIRRLGQRAAWVRRGRNRSRRRRADPGRTAGPVASEICRARLVEAGPTTTVRKKSAPTPRPGSTGRRPAQRLDPDPSRHRRPRLRGRPSPGTFLPNPAEQRRRPAPAVSNAHRLVVTRTEHGDEHPRTRAHAPTRTVWVGRGETASPPLRQAWRPTSEPDTRRTPRVVPVWRLVEATEAATPAIERGHAGHRG